MVFLLFIVHFGLLKRKSCLNSELESKDSLTEIELILKQEKTISLVENCFSKKETYLRCSVSSNSSYLDFKPKTLTIYKNKPAKLTVTQQKLLPENTKETKCTLSVNCANRKSVTTATFLLKKESSASLRLEGVQDEYDPFDCIELVPVVSLSVPTDTSFVLELRKSAKEKVTAKGKIEAKTNKGDAVKINPKSIAGWETGYSATVVLLANPDSVVQLVLEKTIEIRVRKSTFADFVLLPSSLKKLKALELPTAVPIKWAVTGNAPTLKMEAEVRLSDEGCLAVFRKKKGELMSSLDLAQKHGKFYLISIGPNCEAPASLTLEVSIRANTNTFHKDTFVFPVRIDKVAAVKPKIKVDAEDNELGRNRTYEGTLKFSRALFTNIDKTFDAKKLKVKLSADEDDIEISPRKFELETKSVFRGSKKGKKFGFALHVKNKNNSDFKIEAVFSPLYVFLRLPSKKELKFDLLDQPVAKVKIVCPETVVLGMRFVCKVKLAACPHSVDEKGKLYVDVSEHDYEMLDKQSSRLEFKEKNCGVFAGRKKKLEFVAKGVGVTELEFALDGSAKKEFKLDDGKKRTVTVLRDGVFVFVKNFADLPERLVFGENSVAVKLVLNKGVESKDVTVSVLSDDEELDIEPDELVFEKGKTEVCSFRLTAKGTNRRVSKVSFQTDEEFTKSDLYTEEDNTETPEEGLFLPQDFELEIGPRVETEVTLPERNENDEQTNKSVSEEGKVKGIKMHEVILVLVSALVLDAVLERLGFID